VFNPLNKEKVGKEYYESIIKKLAIGRVMDDSAMIPDIYLDFIKKHLTNTQCIIQDELYINKFKECLQTGIIDINILNKPLWGEIEELNF